MWLVTTPVDSELKLLKVENTEQNKNIPLLKLYTNMLHLRELRNKKHFYLLTKSRSYFFQQIINPHPNHCQKCYPHCSFKWLSLPPQIGTRISTTTHKFQITVRYKLIQFILIANSKEYFRNSDQRYIFKQVECCLYIFAHMNKHYHAFQNKWQTHLIIVFVMFHCIVPALNEFEGVYFLKL